MTLDDIKSINDLKLVHDLVIYFHNQKRVKHFRFESNEDEMKYINKVKHLKVTFSTGLIWVPKDALVGEQYSYF